MVVLGFGMAGVVLSERERAVRRDRLRTCGALHRGRRLTEMEALGHGAGAKVERREGRQGRMLATHQQLCVMLFLVRQVQP